MSFNVMGIVEGYSGRLVERYEYTPYGERKVYAHGWLYADLNGDGITNPEDLSEFTLEYGGTSSWYQGDYNGDGNVNSTDLAAQTLSWMVSVDYANADPWVSYPLLRSNRMTAIETPAVPHHSLSLCDFGHQGLMHDEATGLIYNRARMRDPKLGRFMQRDPLGYVDGQNLYATYHVLHSGLDPSGRQVGSETVNLGHKAYVAYLEWYPQGNWGEIKIGKADKHGRIYKELVRYRYDAKTRQVTEIARHGGKPLPGIARNAMKKIAPKIVQATERVVARVGGTPTLTRLAPRPGGGGGRSRAVGGGALSMFLILDLFASPTNAATFESPDYIIRLTPEELDIDAILEIMDEKYIIAEDSSNQTEGFIETPPSPGSVVVASINSCPKEFVEYEIKEADNCWCLWRRRSNAGVSWERAKQQCAATATSGDADRLQVGETICVPE